MSDELISTLSNPLSKLDRTSLIFKNNCSLLNALSLKSEMRNEAFSARTNLLNSKVSSLQNPPSPASLTLSPRQESLEEKLFDATSAVKILTAQVSMHINKTWRDKLFNQVDSLHDIDEWDVDDRPIKKSSFATFLKAILQIKPQRQPGLGLSYEGYLIAAWTTDQDRLTTEFLPKDRVKWVLTSSINGEVERAAGQTAVSRLYECLMPYQPDHWFLYE